MAIVHITGASGSGKTTLIRHLEDIIQGSSLIFDFDDISDRFALKLLKEAKYISNISKGEFNSFYKELDQLINQWFAKIIKNAEKNNIKFIIIGGISIPTHFKPKYKFIINAPRETIYRNVSERTLESICTNKKQISSLIKSKTHPDIIKLICFHKYKLRQNFIEGYHQYDEDYTNFYKDYKLMGYSLLDSKKIAKKIVKLVG